jgi:hypothetical protein
MMGFGKRFIWVLTIVSFLVVTSGCARTNLRSVEDEIARNGTGIHKEKGQSVRGYLLHDGTLEEYKGWARIAEQDSLEFWSEGYSDEVSHQGVKKKIKIPGPFFALSAIKVLDVREARAGRSVLLVVGGFLLALIVFGLATMNTMDGSTELPY